MIKQFWNQGKQILSDSFKHAIHMAHQTDHVVSIGKRIYGALHPLIEQIGGTRFNKTVMDTVRTYDNTRHNALGLYNNVETQYNRLRKSVPELGLD